jgi:hypothetical protein
MEGERFSRLYLRPADLAQDSGRARYRIAALFRERVLSDHAERLAAHIGGEIGIPFPGEGRYSSHWSQFISECRTPDFLDTITLIYRYLFWHGSEEIAHWWRNAVRQIFAEENLAYVLDDVGGVHPAIDQEFQRNLVSTIAAIQLERYQKIRHMVEHASAHLGSEPPNYKQAWRAMSSAVEGLFGLMFPYVQLSIDEIERCLLPAVQGAYEGDPTAQRAARLMLNSFQRWVEASHIYRHQPGAADAPQPPADLAVLAISYGTSLVRWLADLDEGRQRHTT